MGNICICNKKADPVEERLDAIASKSCSQKANTKVSNAEVDCTGSGGVGSIPAKVHPNVNKQSEQIIVQNTDSSTGNDEVSSIPNHNKEKLSQAFSQTSTTIPFDDENYRNSSTSSGSSTIDAMGRSTIEHALAISTVELEGGRNTTNVGRNTIDSITARSSVDTPTTPPLVFGNQTTRQKSPFKSRLTPELAGNVVTEVNNPTGTTTEAEVTSSTPVLDVRPGWISPNSRILAEMQSSLGDTEDRSVFVKRNGSSKNIIKEYDNKRLEPLTSSETVSKSPDAISAAFKCFEKVYANRATEKWNTMTVAVSGLLQMLYDDCNGDWVTFSNTLYFGLSRDDNSSKFSLIFESYLREVINSNNDSNNEFPNKILSNRSLPITVTPNKNNSNNRSNNKSDLVSDSDLTSSSSNVESPLLELRRSPLLNQQSKPSNTTVFYFSEMNKSPQSPIEFHSNSGDPGQQVVQQCRSSETYRKRGAVIQKATSFGGISNMGMQKSTSSISGGTNVATQKTSSIVTGGITSFNKVSSGVVGLTGGLQRSSSHSSISDKRNLTMDNTIMDNTSKLTEEVDKNNKNKPGARIRSEAVQFDILDSLHRNGRCLHPLFSSLEDSPEGDFIPYSDLYDQLYAQKSPSDRGKKTQNFSNVYCKAGLNSNVTNQASTTSSSYMTNPRNTSNHLNDAQVSNHNTVSAGNVAGTTTVFPHRPIQPAYAGHVVVHAGHDVQHEGGKHQPGGHPAGFNIAKGLVHVKGTHQDGGHTSDSPHNDQNNIEANNIDPESTHHMEHEPDHLDSFGNDLVTQLLTGKLSGTDLSNLNLNAENMELLRQQLAGGLGLNGFQMASEMPSPVTNYAFGSPPGQFFSAGSPLGEQFFSASASFSSGSPDDGRSSSSPEDDHLLQDGSLDSFEAGQQLGLFQLADLYDLNIYADDKVICRNTELNKCLSVEFSPLFDHDYYGRSIKDGSMEDGSIGRSIIVDTSSSVKCCIDGERASSSSPARRMLVEERLEFDNKKNSCTDEKKDNSIERNSCRNEIKSSRNSTECNRRIISSFGKTCSTLNNKGNRDSEKKNVSFRLPTSITYVSESEDEELEALEGLLNEYENMQKYGIQ